MRHKKANKKLTSNTNYTEALLYNQSLSLLKSKRIVTTLVKAKALRSYIERAITKAKTAETNLHQKRIILKKFRSNIDCVNMLIEQAKNYVTRNGGYTRVLKLDNRQGDNAQQAIIEFV
jgi:large subunit ribosomal protein L17